MLLLKPVKKRVPSTFAECYPYLNLPLLKNKKRDDINNYNYISHAFPIKLLLNQEATVGFSGKNIFSMVDLLVVETPSLHANF